MPASSFNRDFWLIDARASRLLALAAAKAMQAGTLVVRSEAVGGDRPSRYWLFERRAAIDLLERSAASGAGAALQLHGRDPAETFAVRDLRGPTIHDAIVLAGDRPVGFVRAGLRSRGAIDDVRGGAPIGAHVAGAGSVGAPEFGTRHGVDDGGADVRPTLVRELNAAWNDRIESGSNVALLVSLASLGVGAAASAPMRLEKGARIEAVVRPLRGMTLIGSNTATLIAAEPQPDEPAMFTLTAGGPGTGSVRVYAYAGGRSLAAVDLSTTIVAAGTLGDVKPRRETVAATVSASARTPPDLALFVEECGTEIRYRLSGVKAGTADRAFAPVAIGQDSRAWFAQFAKDIENLAVDTPEQQKVAADTLRLRGANLFQTLLPADLRAALWDLRDRVGTVQITSDEAWIPWEVCCLIGRDGDGRNVEGGFFAEAFPVTRWLHDAAAPDRFRFDEWALVVPKNSRLPSADVEAQHIRDLHRSDRKVTSVAARFADVTAAMESERYFAFHFCGHASAGSNTNGDKAAIELEERESLTADLVAGTVENALRTRPFIFLNACQSAQGGRTLTGVGGWAHRFIRPTFDRYAASAFVGSYWSVYDTAAFAFAKALYDGILLDRKPMGEAVRAARLTARSDADPLSWLAYTVYADPAATAMGSESDS
jgi:hypothetical protein